MGDFPLPLEQLGDWADQEADILLVSVFSRTNLTVSSLGTEATESEYPDVEEVGLLFSSDEQSSAWTKALPAGQVAGHPV